MSEAGLNLLHAGMVTSGGLDAAQAAASILAGICRHEETSVYDKRFAPFTMSLLPDDVLPPLAGGVECIGGLTSRQMRMLRLGTMALQEATSGLTKTEDMPLFLGLPAPLPDRDDPAGESFVEHLCTNTNVPLNLADSRMFPNGRTAGLYALEAAAEYLETNPAGVAIVGGIDTFLDLYLLGTLDSEDRILGEQVMDGFIPGEGAAFLVVSKKADTSGGTFPPLQITAVATSVEEGHLYSEKPYQGEGLTAVFSEVLHFLPSDKKVTDVFSSMNGENHWAKEWGVTAIRNQPLLDEEHAMHHPADCIGDTGAASGLIMIILAAFWKQQGVCGSPALVYCSSDYGERAAVLVS